MFGGRMQGFGSPAGEMDNAQASPTGYRFPGPSQEERFAAHRHGNATPERPASSGFYANHRSHTSQQQQQASPTGYRFMGNPQQASPTGFRPHSMPTGQPQDNFANARSHSSHASQASPTGYRMPFVPAQRQEEPQQEASSSQALPQTSSTGYRFSAGQSQSQSQQAPTFAAPTRGMFGTQMQASPQPFVQQQSQSQNQNQNQNQGFPQAAPFREYSPPTANQRSASSRPQPQAQQRTPVFHPQPQGNPHPQQQHHPHPQPFQHSPYQPQQPRPQQPPNFFQGFGNFANAAQRSQSSFSPSEFMQAAYAQAQAEADARPKNKMPLVRKFKITALESKNLDPCSICLIELDEGEYVYDVPCYHICHTDCIETWWEKELICPTCRNSPEGQHDRSARDLKLRSWRAAHIRKLRKIPLHNLTPSMVRELLTSLSVTFKDTDSDDDCRDMLLCADPSIGVRVRDAEEDAADRLPFLTDDDLRERLRLFGISHEIDAERLLLAKLLLAADKDLRERVEREQQQQSDDEDKDKDADDDTRPNLTIGTKRELSNHANSTSTSSPLPHSPSKKRRVVDQLSDDELRTCLQDRGMAEFVSDGAEREELEDVLLSVDQDLGSPVEDAASPAARPPIYDDSPLPSFTGHARIRCGDGRRLGDLSEDELRGRLAVFGYFAANASREELMGELLELDPSLGVFVNGSPARSVSGGGGGGGGGGADYPPVTPPRPRAESVRETRQRDYLTSLVVSELIGIAGALGVSTVGVCEKGELVELIRQAQSRSD